MAAPSFPSVKSAACLSPARSFGSSSLRADYLNPEASMGFTRRPGVWLTMVALAALAAAAPVSPQAKPTVRVGYIPSDSFAALYIMADRHPPAAGIGVESGRMAGGAESLSQVATGQLHVGGAGMGAAGFNALASALPGEFGAPTPPGYVEDYFTVPQDSW